MHFSTKDFRHLEAAQGWLGLGDAASASKELDDISSKAQRHVDVLMLRSEIALQMERWDSVLEISVALLKSASDKPEPWVHRSYALHELRRTQEGYDKLLPAAKRFTKGWVIPYNLACYLAQLGKTEEANEWFLKAMAQDYWKVMTAAADDPDLSPLRALWQGELPNALFKGKHPSDE